MDWAHYKHPLPEFVCEIYMKYWGKCSFVDNNSGYQISNEAGTHIRMAPIPIAPLGMEDIKECDDVRFAALALFI